MDTNIFLHFNILLHPHNIHMLKMYICTYIKDAYVSNRIEKHLKTNNPILRTSQFRDGKRSLRSRTNISSTKNRILRIAKFSRDMANGVRATLGICRANAFRPADWFYFSNCIAAEFDSTSTELCARVKENDKKDICAKERNRMLRKAIQTFIGTQYLLKDRIKKHIKLQINFFINKRLFYA